MATPTEKMMTARKTDHRLPRKSPAGAPDKAPKNVPTDKIETTRDCWGVVIEHDPVEESYFPKVHNQFCMAWIPPKTPVSKPKRMPPKPAKKLYTG